MDSAQSVESLRAKVNNLKHELQLVWSSSGNSIDFEALEIHDQVGGGGHSIVYRGLWNGTPVAIKQWFNPDHSEGVVQECREEMMTIQQLRHPNVVQFLGGCLRPPHLCMVTEYMPHSLHNIIYNQSIALDNKRLLALALDVARALAYLHSRCPALVHRDVKPANFLVDRAWKVKLCDFGLASNTAKQVGAGTPGYMAPELFQGSSYSSKVDVYAFGVMVNEMLSRRAPFAGQSAADIRQQVLKGQRPDIELSCPPALADLVNTCWHQEPSQRPHFNSIMESLQVLSKQL